MSTEKNTQHQHATDNDSDLSFEALTFGDSNSNSSNTNNTNTNNTQNETQQQQSQDKKDKQFPKKNKDKYRKNKPNKKDSPSHTTPEGEREKNGSVYISTQDDKIDVQPLLKKLEQFGAVRGYYFKEKQNFGIVQFVDPSVVDTVVEHFSNSDSGFQVTVERTPRAKELHASPHSFGSAPAGTPSLAPSTPPPEKPDTILVLKNLPFTLKQDQLHEILLSLSPTIPQSISLHYDNLDDAIQVYELLNGMDVSGRKVRVEYKRKTANSAPNTPNKPPTDIPIEWQEDEELRKLWDQLNNFKDDTTQSEWYYPPTLTNNQHSGSVDSKRGIDIKGRRPRRDSDTNNARPGGAGTSPGSEQTRAGGRGSVGRGESKPHTIASSAPADINLDWRTNQSQSPHHQQSALVAPLRQPKGPDGSKGFADQYPLFMQCTCCCVQTGL